MKISNLHDVGYIQKKKFFNNDDQDLLKKIYKYQKKFIYIVKIRSLVNKIIVFLAKKSNFFFFKTEKSFLIDFLVFKQNKEVIKLIKHFVYHKKISDILKACYKTAPILHGFSILFSPPNRSKKLIKSQLFHFDYGRKDKLIKIFIPLHNITSEAGPLLYLNKQDSLKFKKNYEKKIEDKNVMPQYKSKIKKFIADVGDILFIDTTECIHCGSRNNSKSRCVLMLTFTKNKTDYSKKSMQSLKKFLKN